MDQSGAFSVIVETTRLKKTIETVGGHARASLNADSRAVRHSAAWGRDHEEQAGLGRASLRRSGR